MIRGTEVHNQPRGREKTTSDTLNNSLKAVMSMIVMITTSTMMMNMNYGKQKGLNRTTDIWSLLSDCDQ